MKVKDVNRYAYMLATVAVVGTLGFGFCWLFYQNGIDPLKDGALISLISGLMVIAAKFIPTEIK